MTKFIRLQMFIDQNSKKGGSSYGDKKEAATAKMTIPFQKWKVGYVVYGASEEFTIQEIKSSDGAIHYEDTTVTLVNKAGETRLIKGGTCRHYEFVSTGDVAPPEPEVAAEAPIRDDCQPLIINVAGLREWHPRSRGNEGTQLVCLDKTKYIVADASAAVTAAVNKALAAQKDGIF